MSKIVEIIVLSALVVGIVDCESSSSITATSPDDEATVEETTELAEELEFADFVAEEPDDGDPAIQSEEAEQKYRLASQLLEFAGPIDDLSSESKNVRWLAADLLHTAIELDLTEFKYYRDLFMTYMVLQEPVRAINAIEPATNAPVLADEVAEFQSLVFGALEFASLINSES